MLQESLENLRVLLTKLPAMVNATTVCIDYKLDLLTHHKF